MLKAGALHFARADAFDDKFEGSYPQKNQVVYPSIEDPAYTYEAFKKYAAVSCWHSNLDESEAMWELYLKNTDGVAIITNKKSLEDCLIDRAPSIVKIQYKDFTKEKIEDFAWFKAFEYKRKCFKHEREVRASLYNLPPSTEIVDGFPVAGPPDGANCFPEEGVQVEVDLSRLIKQVVISPKSGQWFESVVRETLNNYSLPKVKVVKSELAGDPLYPQWIT